MTAQGHYIPLFAAEVYDQNAKLVEMGMDPVNLTSIVLGRDIVYDSVACVLNSCGSERENEPVFVSDQRVAVVMML